MKAWPWLSKYGWRSLLFGAVMTATLTMATQLLLRNLYRFLSFDEQFSGIFAQISDAPMAVPILVVFVLSSLYCLLGAQWHAAGIGGTVAAVLVGIVVWLLLLIVAIFFTEVNQVRFGDVLLSLLEMLQKGALEQL